MESIIDKLSARQLKELASLKEQMEVLQQRIDATVRGVTGGVSAAAKPKAAAPASVAPAVKTKRPMSPEVRKRIGAALKKKWAAAKAAGKKSL